MSTNNPVSSTTGRPLVGLLFRTKLRSLRNRVYQAVDEAPLRVAVTVLLISVIWYGLFQLFHLVFQQLKRSPLEATVAIPLVFNFFFVAMLVMLTFSNAIIAYGSLFGKKESSYLLSSPLSPLDVVTLKYVESLVIASWGLVLLGFPLMMSMAEIADSQLFYVLFLAFFLAFIPIPAAMGLLLAWGCALFVPRRVTRSLAILIGLTVSVLVVLGVRSMQVGDAAVELWLRSFQAKMSFLQAAFLPNKWVAAGIDNALHDRMSLSLLYLGVTAANALFLSWFAVRKVAGRFTPALDRAASGQSSGRRIASQASGGLAGSIFFYLPLPLRLVAAKDLRTFMRDPMQWSQLAILFGLLALYLTNMPTLRVQLSGWGWYLVIPFLNLCAVSLILATFTCRFVFPLVSLEGQKLWLVGLLPIPRGKVLYAKFAFAMTVTVGVAVGAMTMAIVILDLTAVWAAVHLIVILAICVALCGTSVGIGARLPMFGEINAARIANGLGGTTNLLTSLGLTSVLLAAIGLATWRCRFLPIDAPPDLGSLLICVSSAILGASAGIVALRLGIRHFNRIDV